HKISEYDNLFGGQRSCLRRTTLTARHLRIYLEVVTRKPSSAVQIRAAHNFVFGSRRLGHIAHICILYSCENIVFMLLSIGLKLSPDPFSICREHSDVIMPFSGSEHVWSESSAKIWPSRKETHHIQPCHFLKIHCEIPHT
ncbi:hypothetical protein ACJX0J_005593, partial [Zea mays]